MNKIIILNFSIIILVLIFSVGPNAYARSASATLQSANVCASLPEGSIENVVVVAQTTVEYFESIFQLAPGEEFLASIVSSDVSNDAKVYFQLLEVIQIPEDPGFMVPRIDAGIIVKLGSDISLDDVQSESLKLVDAQGQIVTELSCSNHDQAGVPVICVSDLFLGHYINASGEPASAIGGANTIKLRTINGCAQHVINFN